AEAERMLELARAESNRPLEGTALADMAYAHFLRLSSDHVPALRRCAEAALKIAREVGDQRLLARTLNLIGAVRQMDGQLIEAQRRLEESMSIARAHGFRDVIISNHLHLGTQANWVGDFPTAIVHGRDVESAAREIHDGFNEVFGMSNRCFAHIALGEYREAFDLIADTKEKASERDNHFIVGRVAN